MHCEPFLAAEIDLGDDHGFTAAQRRQIALITSDCYRKVHDKITLEFFLNGLPKHMFEKVANKPNLTKPSEIIDYLKKCDTVARRNTVVPPLPQQPLQPPTAPQVQEQISANSTYNTSVPHKSSTRGQAFNQQGRNSNNSSQTTAVRKHFVYMYS